MDASVLKYIIFGSIGLLVIAGIAYFALAKQMGKSEYARIKKLQQGTKTSGFSMDVLYQRLYITFIKIPFIKRYLFKLRRRLEILNIDDEYSTRRDSAKILMNAILILIPIVFITIIITKQNILLMSILLIFELFVVDSMTEGMVDKIDNKLLKEQIDFFAEIRHAYHEFNMVEEAIYQVSLDADEQAWKVAADNLPWICVRDPQSVYSHNAAMYNVKTLPTCFVIDRNDGIVKRIEKVDEIENAVQSRL